MRNSFGICLVLTVLFLLGVPSSSFAADVYIAQSAAEANNGLDCADAHALSWFDSGGNWGKASGQIGPGTVVHLCGIITSELAFQGGGISGNVIELLFEPGAKVEISPGADANGAIGLGSYSYILIDGGANQPCGWNTARNASEGTCNGQVENMRYGSSDGACPGGACTQQPSGSIGSLIVGSGSNIEIRNLEIGPSYIHTTTGNYGNDTGGTGCISLANGNNWNIHDNQLHDGGWCITLSWAGNGSYSGWKIANNEIYNSSHMVAIAGADAGMLNGVTFQGNYTHGMGNWDTRSDAWHGDGVHVYGSAGQALSRLIIANNIMTPASGANITAQIFTETPITLQQVYLFNNLIYGESGQGNLIDLTTCTKECYILNNTLVGGANTGACIYEGSTAPYLITAEENNASTGCWYNFSTNDSALPSFSTLDSNAYGPAGGGDPWKWGNSFESTIAAWRASSGEGADSFYNSSGLDLNTNYAPSSGSPLLNAGINLSGLCSGDLTDLCKDLAGNARPSSGKWGIGAVQQAGLQPSPPTNLTGVVGSR